MTVLNLLFYNIVIDDLSVGNWYQNIIFYATIVLMGFTNVYLIRAKQKNKGIAAGNTIAEETIITPQEQRETELEIQLNALKDQLLATGQELELSYANADRLNTLLQEALDCLNAKFDFKETSAEEADKKDVQKTLAAADRCLKTNSNTTGQNNENNANSPLI